jgi:Flp pilus assembly secretin CpaC
MRALLAAAFCLFAAAPAGAQSLALRVGEARAVSLPGWATGIVVGSPAVIEVAVHDNQTILVTGKSQGVSSLLAIDSGGQTLVLSDIQVIQGNDAGQVTVSAARRQQTFSCMPRCEPTVAIGDTPDFTAATGASIRQRMTGGGQP